MSAQEPHCELELAAAAAATVASVGSNSMVSGPGTGRLDVRHPRRGRAEAHAGRSVDQYGL